MSQMLTLADVAKHTSRDDLYIILGSTVYDVSSFIGEHPGGEEVLLELAGQDATEGFNEANHTRRAHEILSELAIGNVERVECDPAPLLLKDNTGSGEPPIKEPRRISGDTTGVGIMAYVIAILLGVFIAFAAYQYYNSEEVQP